MTGRLSGGHQAAVMCMEVGKLSNEEDLVITGSKDHYIKVVFQFVPYNLCLDSRFITVLICHSDIRNFESGCGVVH